MSTNSMTPNEKASIKRGFRTIGLIVLAVDLVLVAILTVTQMLLGSAVITSFIDDGNAQTMGNVGWFFASLMSSVCTVIALDFIVGVAGFIFMVLWSLFTGGPRKNSGSAS